MRTSIFCNYGKKKKAAQSSTTVPQAIELRRQASGFRVPVLGVHHQVFSLQYDSPLECSHHQTRRKLYSCLIGKSTPFSCECHRSQFVHFTSLLTTSHPKQSPPSGGSVPRNQWQWYSSTRVVLCSCRHGRECALNNTRCQCFDITLWTNKRDEQRCNEEIKTVRAWRPPNAKQSKIQCSTHPSKCKLSQSMQHNILLQLEVVVGIAVTMVLMYDRIASSIVATIPRASATTPKYKMPMSKATPWIWDETLHSRPLSQVKTSTNTTLSSHAMQTTHAAKTFARQ